MYEIYHDYYKEKRKIIKELADKKRIGSKYIISYGDLLPADTNQATNALSELDVDQELFLEDIKNYQTIIEYQGEGLYKDLITGALILNDLSEEIPKITEHAFACFSRLGTNKEDSNISIDFFGYSEETLDYIREDLEKKEFIVLSKVYDRLLNKEDLETSQKEEIRSRKKALEEKNIGKKYAIQYDGLEPVINSELSDYYLKGGFNYSLLQCYTIVEYLGDGLYEDLTTGIIYQTDSTDIKLQKDGQRIDYTKINQKEFTRALEYPIRVPLKSLKIINDNILLGIKKKTLEYSDLAKEMQVVVKKLQSNYKMKKERMLMEEERRQYREAQTEYKQYLLEQKRQQELAEVKKLYKLKK